MRITAFIILFTLASFWADAQSVDYKYQSLFINNFARNIEWPPESQTGDFIIAIYDNAKVAGEIETFFQNKVVGTRKIVVVKFSSLEAIPTCHILFVPIGNKNNIAQIVNKLGDNHTLLITEKEGWGRQGSVINFVISDDGKMKFEINKEAAKKHFLKIPGTLINLAIVI
jgi:hypothetical protein